MGYQFQTTGLARTTPSKSAFITGLMVVMVPLLSIIPGLRPPGARLPRWNVFLGAALAFTGIVLLTAPAAIAGFWFEFTAGEAARLLPDLSSINLGDVLTLGCALGFAFHCIALSHVSPRIAFQPLALLQVGFCAVFMALSMPLIEHPQIHGRRGWPWRWELPPCWLLPRHIPFRAGRSRCCPPRTLPCC
jgi:drug/metabolite transporter (DMT)-like permease